METLPKRGDGQKKKKKRKKAKKNKKDERGLKKEKRKKKKEKNPSLAPARARYRLRLSARSRGSGDVGFGPANRAPEAMRAAERVRGEGPLPQGHGDLSGGEQRSESGRSCHCKPFQNPNFDPNFDPYPCLILLYFS